MIVMIICEKVGTCEMHIYILDCCALLNGKLISTITSIHFLLKNIILF